MSLLDRLTSSGTSAKGPLASRIGRGTGASLASPPSAGLSHLLGASSASGRRFSVYGTEDRVVIDLGSHTLKCGFSGEPQPRGVLTLGHALQWNQQSTQPVFLSQPTAESSFADTRALAPEVMNHRQVAAPDLYSLAIHDTDPTDLHDSLVYHLSQMFYDVLMTDPKLRKVLVCDSPLAPLALKRALGQVLFGHFCVPSIAFFPAQALALLTVGSLQGLVIDCGHLETLALSVFDGHCLVPHIQTTPLAGKALSDHLRRLLEQYATLVIPESLSSWFTSHGYQVPPVSKVLSNDVVNDIKMRLLFVSPVRPPWLPSASATASIPSLEEQHQWYQQMTTATGMTCPLIIDVGQLSTSSGLPATMPDAPPIKLALHIPGWVRERACEILFGGDVDQDLAGVPSVVLNALHRTPIDLRPHLAAGCLVTGGTAMLPNFKDRLHLELQQHILHQPRYQAMAQLCDKFAFLDAHANGQLFAPHHRIWLGGSLMGALRCPGPEVSRDDFSGQVPDWTLGDEL
ncbi:hypothetical protein H4R34_004278 [Dimargaris verticillata]|uniref:Uncharacterized protein n=1 Tax=Dimargaris verticillata TaxID=2761393 RepID=A0A9W8B0W1_9FUNG|nr:hypothetical protein H4R34_004278 [Dimargaris verticillata]